MLTPQGIAEKTALIGVYSKHKMQECHLLKEEIEALSQETLSAKTTVKDAPIVKVEVSVNGHGVTVPSN